MFMLLMFVALWRRVKLISKSPELHGLAVVATFIWFFGATFYHFHEGWSWVNSLYFCAVTLATIGYGDYTPTTNLSKVFTIFYIIIGIGIISVFISEIARIAKEDVIKREEARLNAGKGTPNES
jgi:voltage-gated potassium channel